MNVTEAIASLKIPFTLAPLQLQDVTELANYEKVGLFWEVGVGKSVAATILAQSWERHHNVLVMPHVLIPQWQEWLKLVDPEGKVTIYYGTKRQPDDLDGKWVLTSTNIFRDDFAKIAVHYAKKEIALFIDEAQSLKNSQSKLFSCVKTLAQGQHLGLMTGTPTSTPEDSYTFITLKTPGLYRSKGHFMNVHAGERDFWNRVLSWNELDLLSERLMLQATKRTKEEVFAGQLNPPVYRVAHYDLEPAHAKLYEKLVDEAIIELESTGEKIDATTPQRMYHTVQQMVMNYGYFADKPEKIAAGFDLLDSAIEQSECLSPDKTKLMVWIYYRRSALTVANYIRNKYGKDNPNMVVIANSDHDSKKAVQAFLHDPACRVMVAMPDSVGVGLNAMTVCWFQLFLEFATVSMKNRQAIGRIDRMGQKHIPNIWFAVARNTVQVWLMEQLFDKDDTVSRVERNTRTLRDALLGR